MSQAKSTLTVSPNATIYNGTKPPIKKPKRRNKSDLGPDFIAPDGGWGWIVCIAAGLSTFSVFPSLQQYGILYRHRMHALGFAGKQITSIVNMELATSTLIGVINGAMFRRFTFRQVALTGGVFVFIGITLTAFCKTFMQYAICFSLIYGMGIGLNTSATALAVNTYFKKHRRRATAVTWTITGLGPIVFPHITTYLLKSFGTQGAILIIAAIALNTLACGITLQPVLWHVKPKKVETKSDASKNPQENTTEESEENDSDPYYLCKYCQYKKEGKRSIFSSDYVFNDNDPDRPGYEIIEPGPPMLARANDGWFGSKISLSSDQNELRRRFSKKSLIETEAAEFNENASYHSEANYFNQEREERERYLGKSISKDIKNDNLCSCTCAEGHDLLQKSIIEQQNQQIEEEKAEEVIKRKMTFKQKVVKFFDLDLLRDLTFVNLVQGMTIMMFGEMNFSFLTPFILDSYGYKNEQISLAMSLLGGMDIVMRFMAPFVLEKLKFGNSTLFAFGIVIITIGRSLVTLIDSYYVMLGLFMLIGFGKSFRTIFAPLIIPSYVPLHRLPAASGLQLVCNTLLSLMCGPLLGVIADSFSYNAAIHFINFSSMCSLSLWVIEWLVRRTLGKPKSHTQQH